MELDDWLNEINNFRITGQDLETLVNKEAYRINACGADVQIEMLVHMLGDDSNTYGHGLGTPATQRWTALLAAMFGATEANYGINASTLSHCPTLGNGGGANSNAEWQYIPPVVSGAAMPLTTVGTVGFLYQALLDSGAIYTFALGLNDASYSGNLTAYIASLTQSMTQLQSAGIPMQQLLVAGIPYCSATGGSTPLGYYTPTLAKLWNAAIQVVAAQFGAIYLDVYTPTSAGGGLQGDGVHWSQACHLAVATAAYNAICGSRIGTVSNYVPN